MADNITEKKLGIIEVDALRDANGLMEGNTHLTSVECPFPALTNGSNMFKDCINLTRFYCDDLTKLNNGTSMFWGCEKLSTVVGGGGNPLNLSSLSNGTSMFYYTKISEFATDLPNLTYGTSMFLDSSLTIFDSSLPIISSYNDMFAGCPLSTFKCKELGIRSSGKDFITTSKLEDTKFSLIDFNANMPYVTIANEMFIGFKSLKNFEGNMPSLTNADKMFSGSSLETFKSDNLSKLTTATNMFENCNSVSSGYNGFTTFDCDELPSLDNGNRMFYDTNLSSFNATLPKLTNGNEMFYSTCISSFDIELPYLSLANSMFKDCDSLKSVTSDLPKLSTYSNMFMGTKLNTFDGGDIGITDTGLDFITNSDIKYSKDTLTSFKGNLTKSTNTDNTFTQFNKLEYFEGDMPNVTSSESMFEDCRSLKSFVSKDLSKLSNGTNMFFGCYNLSYINAQFPELTNGIGMFCYTTLSSFDVELPYLSIATQMFKDCGSLETFNSNLSSLTSYSNMFDNCTLQIFDATCLNVNDSGLTFITGSGLNDSKPTLEHFTSNLPQMVDTSEMFESFTNLKSF